MTIKQKRYLTTYTPSDDAEMAKSQHFDKHDEWAANPDNEVLMFCDFSSYFLFILCL